MPKRKPARPERLPVITVFGSSRPREGDADYESARALGLALAQRGFAVCTGGYGGVMEAASRGAKEGGGRVLAVTAKFFHPHANRWVDEEFRAATWQQRLFELIRRGDGYVACKGGTGTLVELAVVWEMLNKGIVRRPKPFVVLGAFWAPVLECVREVECERSKWAESESALVRVADTPEAAAAFLAERLLEAKLGAKAAAKPAPALF
ncbi:MAG: LOG family protein [Candidatus Acidiferrales bacterium]|jgi:uncharacterized protein (TIGR00730 family)